MHEDYVRTLFGNVGAGSNGQAHIGAGESGGVVDAVSHHGNAVAGPLQLVHMALFVGRHDACNHGCAVDSHAACNRLGGDGIVAGEHHGADAQVRERPDRLRARGLYFVGDGDDAHELTVFGKEQRRFALRGERDEGLVAVGDAQAVHESSVAGGDDILSLVRRDALSGDGAEVLDAAGNDAHLVGSLHDGFGQGMLAAAFEGTGELHQLLLGHGAAVAAHLGQDVDDGGLAARDRAGFVEHDGVNLLERLERFGIFKEHTHFGAAAGAHHNGYGRGEAERAGAADYQDGDACGERLRNAAAHGEPYDKRDGGDAQHHGYKDACHFVGQARNGRLRGVGVFDQLDDL